MATLWGGAERPRTWAAGSTAPSARGGTGATPRRRAATVRARRLVHEPALDGLRGVAVLAVLVFHLGRLQGGFLGVDLFFMLSGYLITSLLVVERRTRGGIALGRVLGPPGRRLLPALIVMLAGVAVCWRPDRRRRPPAYRGDALATLGYVANWERMLAAVSYWDIFARPSPLDHTWSLAIEEQFYLVWPLVALVVLGGWRLRRRPMPARAGGPVAGTDAGNGPARSTAPTAAQPGPIEGAPARAARTGRWPGVARRARTAVVAGRHQPGLLRNRRPPRPDPPRGGRGDGDGPAWPARRAAVVALDAVAAIALAGMAAAMLVVDGQGAYYRGGLAAFTVAALVVMVAVTGGPPGRVGRALSWSPLAALGVISYGVYLWHWPVIVYLTPERLGVRRSVAQAVCVVVTLALAVGSYRLVERPIRRGALSGRRAIGVAAASVAVVLVAVVVTTRGPLSERTATGRASVPEAGSRRYEFEPQDVARGRPGCCWWGTAAPPSSGSSWPTSPPAPAIASPSGCRRSWTAPPAGSRRGPVPGRPGGRAVPVPRRAAGTLGPPGPSMRADVVVIYIANAGGVAEQWVDDDWRTDCDAAFDAAMEREPSGGCRRPRRDGRDGRAGHEPRHGQLHGQVEVTTACRNDSTAAPRPTTPGR